MKTIMIIDGAENCAYDCFGVGETLFAAIFPSEGQDIEFIEDFVQRGLTSEIEQEFAKMWSNPISKPKVKGIDGMLFFELSNKKRFYPNKRDTDLDEHGRSFSLESLRNGTT